MLAAFGTAVSSYVYASCRLLNFGLLLISSLQSVYSVACYLTMAKENVWFKDNNAGASSFSRKIEPYLTVLEANEENNLLVGANEMGGNRWSGSLWLFRNPEDPPDLAKSIAGIEMNVGVACARFLHGTSQIIVSDYDATLALMDVTKPADDCPVYFTKLSVFKPQCDFVSCIDVGKDPNVMVSGSSDGCVSYWDIEFGLSKYVYELGYPVLEVAMKPEEDVLFASGQISGRAFMWDVREDTPTTLIANRLVGLASLQWVNESVLAVGDLAGELFTVDVRTRKIIDSCQLSNFPIRKLRVNRNSQLLACSVDDPSLRVFSCPSGKLQSVYESHSHTDFVSGLTWSPHSCVLHSSGWDTQVFSHTIPAVEDPLKPTAGSLETEGNTQQAPDGSSQIDSITKVVW